MNKLSILIICLVGFATIANAAETIYQENNDWLKLSWKTPTQVNGQRIRFYGSFEENLEGGEAVTVICVKTANNFVVDIGDPAWAFQSWCGLGAGQQCSFNYFLGHALMASHIDTANHWAEGGLDLSSLSEGVYEAGPGTSPDTSYNFSESQFNSSNLPKETDEAYYKCYWKKSGYVGLNSGINLDGTFESVNFSMNVPPCTAR